MQDEKLKHDYKLALSWFDENFNNAESFEPYEPINTVRHALHTAEANEALLKQMAEALEICHPNLLGRMIDGRYWIKEYDIEKMREALAAYKGNKIAEDLTHPTEKEKI